MIGNEVAEQRTIAIAVQPVILSGGAGSRLWPLSREQHPKQLLALSGEYTLLQATAKRLERTAPLSGHPVQSPIIVVNEDYRFLTAEQLRQASVTPASIILEPFGRNTAPALTLAALEATSGGNDPILVVMPADHIITDVREFRETVARGIPHAETGRIVTFGVTPTRAETGYGYIRVEVSGMTYGNAFPIVAFVEKPSAAAAAQYVESGEYLWNSGIFMMRASVWMARLAEARPDIAAACSAAFAASCDDRDFLRIGQEAFASCPSDSIDFAIMEDMAPGLGIMIPLTAGWSDVGAWDALWQLGTKDAEENVFHGDVISIATNRSLAVSQSRLIALVGIEETIVVETADAVLVAHKSHTQKIKEVVGRLKAARRTEADAHRKVYRPWGSYDSIDTGNRFRVKRIVVTPGAALSLQMHHHRAEHWVVVRGTARVTRNEETFLLSENESTFIPIGTRHRLENPGKVPLEIIEVQSGEYLDEDDIVRYDDAYGRT